MDIPDSLVGRFIEAFGDPDTAIEVGTALQCAEVDALADLLRAMGAPGLAEHWVESHAAGDYEEDAHYGVS